MSAHTRIITLQSKGERRSQQRDSVYFRSGGGGGRTPAPVAAPPSDRPLPALPLSTVSGLTTSNLDDFREALPEPAPLSGLLESAWEPLLPRTPLAIAAVRAAMPLAPTPPCFAPCRHQRPTAEVWQHRKKHHTALASASEDPHPTDGCLVPTRLATRPLSALPS